MSFPRYAEYKDCGVEWLGGANNFLSRKAICS